MVDFKVEKKKKWEIPYWRVIQFNHTYYTIRCLVAKYDRMAHAAIQHPHTPLVPISICNRTMSAPPTSSLSLFDFLNSKMLCGFDGSTYIWWSRYGKRTKSVPKGKKKMKWNRKMEKFNLFFFLLFSLLSFADGTRHWSNFLQLHLYLQPKENSSQAYLCF